MSLLKSFLKGEQKPIPHNQRTPITCVDGTRIFAVENGSLLEKKVTHALVEVLELHGKPVPVAWRHIPNEDTYHGITAQALKRFVTSHGGEHPLLVSWYNIWKEVQAEYKTGQGQYDGLVTEPGKFQTEMLYVPFFWHVALDGCGDGFYWEDDAHRMVDWFYLNDWKVIFPPSLIKSSLGDDEKSFLLLRETDQGFVETEIKTELPVSG